MAQKQEKLEKARVAKVQIGTIEVEGLMLPDGSFAIAAVQINEIIKLSESPRNAPRSLRRILGKGFQTLRVKSELNPQAVHAVTLDQFLEVIKVAAKKGNQPALDLVIMLAGLSLHQLWSDAFNRKFDQEERQRYLVLRQARIAARKSWVDCIRDRHLSLFGIPATPALYKSLTVLINQRLFDQPHFNRDRDNMTEEQQQKILIFEGMLVLRMERHPLERPDEAVIQTLNHFT